MPTIADQIKADPLAFAGGTPIKIAYSSPNSQFVANYKYGNRDSILRFGNNSIVADGVQEVPAYGIAAKRGAPDFFTLGAQANLMLTSQLTGCCIVIDRSGGGVRVAHVQPDSGQDGGDLQNSLSNGGYALWGKNNYIGSICYVFGINTGKTWKFFAQQRVDDYGTKIDFAREICANY